VQLTPLARFLGWARFTRQNASACWRPDTPQPSHVRDDPTLPALQGSAARALPGSCLSPTSSTLHPPASGAADARRSAASPRSWWAGGGWQAPDRANARGVPGGMTAWRARPVVARWDDGKVCPAR